MSEANKLDSKTQDLVSAAVSAAMEVERAKSEVERAKSATVSSAAVHTDKPLSDFSIQVVQADTDFKATKMVSNFNSKHQSDQYYFYEPAYFMINQVKARSEGTESAKARYAVSRKFYNTTVYSLSQPVTDEQVANSDQAIEKDYEDAVKFITRQFLLNREKKCTAALMKAGEWSTDWSGKDGVNTGNALVLNGEFQKFTKDTAKPLDVLDAAFEAIQLKSGMRPNTIAMTRQVFGVLKHHLSIKSQSMYTATDSGTDDRTIATIANHVGIPTTGIYILDVVEPSAFDAGSGDYEIITDSEGYASGTEDDDSTTYANQFMGGNGILIMHIN